MSNLGNAQLFATSRKEVKNRITNPTPVGPGDKFNDWTVIKQVEFSSNMNKRKYMVECKCGGVATVAENALKYNLSHRCYFCNMKDRRKNRHKKSLIINGIPCPK